MRNLKRGWGITFLINLDKRTDRWADYLKHSSELHFPTLRFSAVTAESLGLHELRLPSTVAACWKSHQGVARAFLDSDAEHCLVLEDDVHLTQAAIEALNQIWEKSFQGIDLLQLGFCVHNNRLANRTSYRLQRRIIGLTKSFRMLNLSVIRKLLSALYGYEFLFLEQILQPVAQNTFELGTHAYVMSRNFAETMIQFNDPVYLPADLALMELANTKKFNSLRLVTSLVDQTDSPSSISNASANSLEKEISRIGKLHEL
jgi:GR25 family glycosyltransferase involved in LPS biosynthesis